ncbi:hypothetical protein KZ324_09610, partial [Glaesserella parasuis]|nr:hypothetical protein [Glaesserella parasuis]
APPHFFNPNFFLSFYAKIVSTPQFLEKNTNLIKVVSDLKFLFIPIISFKSVGSKGLLKGRAIVDFR